MFATLVMQKLKSLSHCPFIGQEANQLHHLFVCFIRRFFAVLEGCVHYLLH